MNVNLTAKLSKATLRYTESTSYFNTSWVIYLLHVCFNLATARLSSDI